MSHHPTSQSLVTEVNALIDAIYGYSCVGGNCHIVLDDYNILDEHLDWVLSDAIRQNAHDATAAHLDVERRCMEIMRGMTMRERAEILAGRDGYVTADEIMAANDETGPSGRHVTAWS